MTALRSGLGAAVCGVAQHLLAVPVDLVGAARADPDRQRPRLVAYTKVSARPHAFSRGRMIAPNET